MHSHSGSKDSGHSSSGSHTPGSASVNALVHEHSSSSSLLAAANREKARQWIRDHAVTFKHKYDGDTDAATEPTVLVRLALVIQKLSGNMESCVDALNDLKQILLISDISPFEFNHSGLIRSMLKYMTSDQEIVARDDRLRAFLNVFAGLPLDVARFVGVFFFCSDISHFFAAFSIGNLKFNVFFFRIRAASTAWYCRRQPSTKQRSARSWRS